MTRFVAGMLLIAHLPFQGFKIDLDKLMEIESSFNEMAFNPHTEARGLFQITPILLEEWNNYHPKEVHNTNDLHTPEISLKIASWYLGQRIPQMLIYHKKEVSLKNVLICWNAGIRYVVNPYLRLPKETQNFVKKYENKETSR